MKRKAIGKKTRFEVFKRDKFSCQYCGAKAPDATLVIDHINPVAKGGDNEILNLITSCDGCNSGKGARTLDDDSVLAKQRLQIERLAERREQIEMMLEWSRGLADESSYAAEAIATRWQELNPGFHLTDAGVRSASLLLKKFSLLEILEAMHTAANQYVVIGEDGALDRESVEIAWGKVPGIAYLTKQPEAKRNAHYIRGILRNRLSYINEHDAIAYIEKAVESGVDIDRIRSLACSCNSWSQWRDKVIEATVAAGGVEDARP